MSLPFLPSLVYLVETLKKTAFFLTINGGRMSMYKVVDPKGNEAIVEVEQYHRGKVLELACEKMYGTATIDKMIGHFRITPLV